MNTNAERTARSWAADLCHPMPLAAVALLLVNDHWLKGSGLLAAPLTGKLSDVAGLFFFPILCVVLARGLTAALDRPAIGSGRAIVTLAVGLTAVGFAAIKLSPEINHAAAVIWGSNAMDRSDLYALPMAGLSWSWMMSRRVRRPSHRRPSFAQGAAIAVAALASIATPAPRYPRNFPAWQITGDASHTHSCLAARAWVSKSGKSGVGLTVELRQIGEQPCQVAIRRTELVLSGQPAIAGGLTADSFTVTGVKHVYLPFLFDNNAAWNRGLRDGRFILELVVGGRPDRWELIANHRLDGFHVDNYKTRGRQQWRAR